MQTRSHQKKKEIEIQIEKKRKNDKENVFLGPPFRAPKKKLERLVNRLCSIRMYFLMG